MKIKIIRSIFKAAFNILKDKRSKLDDFFSKKILITEADFKMSFVSVILIQYIKIILPRTASFLLCYKYRAGINLLNELNIEVKHAICTTLKNKAQLDIKEFEFFIHTLKMPITAFLLFQVYDFMNKKQRAALIARVKKIINELSSSNQILYCKQLLYLFIRHELNESAFIVFMDIIHESTADIVCEKFPNYEYCSELINKLLKTNKSLIFQNLTVINEDFFVINDRLYIFDPKVASTDTNFYKLNMFFLKNENNFYYLNKRNNKLENLKNLKYATIFITKNPIDEKYILFNQIVYFLSNKASENIEFKKHILLPKNFDNEIIKYLRGKFESTEFHQLDASFSIEKILFISPMIQNSLNAIESKIIKNTVMNKNYLEPLMFKNKLIIMTGSFPSLTEKEQISLVGMTKGKGAFFLDIHIASLEEILCAFLFAKIIICGEDPIQEFIFLRSPNKKTIIIKSIVNDKPIRNEFFQKCRIKKTAFNDIESELVS